MTGRVLTNDEVVPAVEAVVRQCAGVHTVDLVGSRARGTATTLSDWDFNVEASNFAVVFDALPQIVDDLAPLAKQWDRLSDQHCYMLLMRGPCKIDLLFEERHRHEPPWVVTTETLRQVDDHFWDWTLWLASKRLGSKEDLVEAELDRLTEHILSPMGVETGPSSIEGAIEAYLGARSRLEAAFGVTVPTDAQDAVLRGIDAAR